MKRALQIAAFVLFLSTSIGVGASLHVALLPLGLAFWVLSEFV